MLKRKSLVILAVWILLCGILPASLSMAGAKNYKKLYATLIHLEKKLRNLEEKVARQEDTEAIRTLMYTYAHYMDRALYDQVLDLFSENMESCEIGGRGIYLGKEGCRTLWKEIFGPAYGGADNQLKFGWLVDHHVTKLVVTVAPDGKTAQSRGNYFSLGGIFGHPEYAGIQMGIYQMKYVKENGVWKISKFWLPFSTTGYNFTTWAANPSYSGCPSEEYPPDLPTSNYHPFPEVYVVPFHYPNPVTGKEVPQNGYTDSKRYWKGNWPDNWGECGHE